MQEYKMKKDRTEGTYTFRINGLFSLNPRDLVKILLVALLIIVSARQAEREHINALQEEALLGSAREIIMPSGCVTNLFSTVKFRHSHIFLRIILKQNNSQLNGFIISYSETHIQKTAVPDKFPRWTKSTFT